MTIAIKNQNQETSGAPTWQTGGLTQEQKYFLLDAARRYLSQSTHTFQKNFTKFYAGVGTPVTYGHMAKTGYMELANANLLTPRHEEHCWILTPKGAAIVKIFIAALTLEQIIKEQDKARIKLTCHALEDYPTQVHAEKAIAKTKATPQANYFPLFYMAGL